MAQAVQDLAAEEKGHAGIQQPQKHNEQRSQLGHQQEPRVYLGPAGLYFLSRHARLLIEGKGAVKGALEPVHQHGKGIIAKDGKDEPQNHQLSGHGRQKGQGKKLQP